MLRTFQMALVHVHSENKQLNHLDKITNGFNALFNIPVVFQTFENEPSSKCLVWSSRSPGLSVSSLSA